MIAEARAEAEGCGGKAAFLDLVEQANQPERVEEAGTTAWSGVWRRAQALQCRQS